MKKVTINDFKTLLFINPALTEQAVNEGNIAVTDNNGNILSKDFAFKIIEDFKHAISETDNVNETVSVNETDNVTQNVTANVSDTIPDMMSRYTKHLATAKETSKNLQRTSDRLAVPLESAKSVSSYVAPLSETEIEERKLGITSPTEKFIYKHRKGLQELGERGLAMSAGALEGSLLYDVRKHEVPVTWGSGGIEKREVTEITRDAIEKHPIAWWVGRIIPDLAWLVLGGHVFQKTLETGIRGISKVVGKETTSAVLNKIGKMASTKLGSMLLRSTMEGGGFATAETITRTIKHIIDKEPPNKEDALAILNSFGTGFVFGVPAELIPKKALQVAASATLASAIPLTEKLVRKEPITKDDYVLAALQATLFTALGALGGTKKAGKKIKTSEELKLFKERALDRTTELVLDYAKSQGYQLSYTDGRRIANTLLLKKMKSDPRNIKEFFSKAKLDELSESLFNEFKKVYDKSRQSIQKTTTKVKTEIIKSIEPRESIEFARLKNLNQKVKKLENEFGIKLISDERKALIDYVSRPEMESAAKGINIQYLRKYKKGMLEELEKYFNVKDAQNEVAYILRADPIMNQPINKFKDVKSIAFIDANGLKALNDIVGKEAGDALIVKLYNSLSSIDKSITVRYSGAADEFIILSKLPKGELERKLYEVKYNLGHNKIVTNKGDAIEPRFTAIITDMNLKGIPEKPEMRLKDLADKLIKNKLAPINANVKKVMKGSIEERARKLEDIMDTVIKTFDFENVTKFDNKKIESILKSNKSEDSKIRELMNELAKMGMFKIEKIHPKETTTTPSLKFEPPTVMKGTYEKLKTMKLPPTFSFLKEKLGISDKAFEELTRYNMEDIFTDPYLFERFKRTVVDDLKKQTKKQTYFNLKKNYKELFKNVKTNTKEQEILNKTLNDYSIMFTGKKFDNLNLDELMTVKTILNIVTDTNLKNRNAYKFLTNPTMNKIYRSVLSETATPGKLSISEAVYNLLFDWVPFNQTAREFENRYKAYSIWNDLYFTHEKTLSKTTDIFNILEKSNLNRKEVASIVRSLRTGKIEGNTKVRNVTNQIREILYELGIKDLSGLETIHNKKFKLVPNQLMEMVTTMAEKGGTTKDLAYLLELYNRTYTTEKVMRKWYRYIKNMPTKLKEEFITRAAKLTGIPYRTDLEVATAIEDIAKSIGMDYVNKENVAEFAKITQKGIIASGIGFRGSSVFKNIFQGPTHNVKDLGYLQYIRGLFLANAPKSKLDPEMIKAAEEAGILRSRGVPTVETTKRPQKFKSALNFIKSKEYKKILEDGFNEHEAEIRKYLAEKGLIKDAKAPTKIVKKVYNKLMDASVFAFEIVDKRGNRVPAFFGAYTMLDEAIKSGDRTRVLELLKTRHPSVRNAVLDRISKGDVKGALKIYSLDVVADSQWLYHLMGNAPKTKSTVGKVIWSFFSWPSNFYTSMLPNAIRYNPIGLIKYATTLLGSVLLVKKIFGIDPKMFISQFSGPLLYSAIDNTKRSARYIIKHAKEKKYERLARDIYRLGPMVPPFIYWPVRAYLFYSDVEGGRIKKAKTGELLHAKTGAIVEPYYIGGEDVTEFLRKKEYELFRREFPKTIKSGRTLEYIEDFLGYPMIQSYHKQFLKYIKEGKYEKAKKLNNYVREKWGLTFKWPNPTKH